MFTGIVTDLGVVDALEAMKGGCKLTVRASSALEGLSIGESVAVNGVCLTVMELDDDTFTVQIVDESLERTALGALEAGSSVNLERPMPADGRFDGHIVQGHVDGVGVLQSITDEGAASRLRIGLPQDLERYVVEKGSITVDGTSLTVTGVSDPDTQDPWFEVVLIPHTRRVTVFGVAKVGTRVNLEVDVIAKYVERMMGERR